MMIWLINYKNDVLDHCTTGPVVVLSCIFEPLTVLKKASASL